ncbi:hypothetical protein M3615_21630, partial [Bacillus halotolerans]|nr:hypothetical protein [Bacillus halotolerans]
MTNPNGAATPRGLHRGSRPHAESATPGLDALYARLSRRIIPLILVCYFFGYLDRVNVGFAKLQMVTDLHLT